MTDEEKTGRGRPRPTATLERDEKVLAHLTANGAKSRKQLVEELELAGNEVYLSLYRLSRDQKIKRDGSAWVTVSADA